MNDFPMKSSCKNIRVICHWKPQTNSLEWVESQLWKIRSGKFGKIYRNFLPINGGNCDLPLKLFKHGTETEGNDGTREEI